MDKLVMGYWDCRYCGTKKIKGTYQSCQYCGHARDHETKFYMDMNNIEYLTEEEEELKGKGADWLCAYCDSLNSILDDHCTNCGASHEDSVKNYFDLKKQREEKLRESKLQEKNDDYEEVRDTNRSGNNGSNSGGLNQMFSNVKNLMSPRAPRFLALFLMLIAFAGLIFLFIPKARELTVTECSWNYTIQVESYETVEESDWDLPARAELLYTNSEIHHYDSVLDHYETKTRTYTEQVLSGYRTETSYSDNGDGTFTEHSYQVPEYTTETKTETYQEPVYVQVPVYETKYYYNIDKWIYKRSVTTNGTDKDPYWGELNLADNEREGSNIETYYITAYEKDVEETAKYQIDATNWRDINVGDVIKVKTSFGVIVEFIE